MDAVEQGFPLCDETHRLDEIRGAHDARGGRQVERGLGGGVGFGAGEDLPGGGLFRQLFTHLLAIGYDQGYQDGVAARDIRERDRVFYDPYAYDNAAYDPYSVSLGDNRRCLSQGYELGYQDAINEIDGYDQFQDGGVDLISVLIGTVSQLI